MKIRSVLFACLLLTACQTPEQIAAQQQMQYEQDVETCRSYGFRPKSDAFSNCMLQLDIARQQRYYYDSNNYYYGGYYGYPHHRVGSSVGYYIGH
jgi:hypothetical protein